MTREEVGKRYQIPVKILKEYESFGLSAAVKKKRAKGSMMIRT